MPINTRCLRKLSAIGLPMIVEVLSTNGSLLGQAKIHMDGKITYLKTGRTYDHPSALRQDVISKNTATYKYLRYNGALLSNLGVAP